MASDLRFRVATIPLGSRGFPANCAPNVTYTPASSRRRGVGLAPGQQPISKDPCAPLNIEQVDGHTRCERAHSRTSHAR
jgi:hypothetical protein